MTVPADHVVQQAAVWQAYWAQVDAAAARQTGQAVAQQRSDTAAQVTIGIGLVLLVPTLLTAARPSRGSSCSCSSSRN